MRFKVYSDDANQLVLMRSSALQDIFDQDDLAMKQNPDKEILNEYHENWIHKGIFIVPSFFIRGQHAMVGNGRHRLIMLSRHMREIPVAFERRFSVSDIIDQVVEKMIVRGLCRFEIIEYPDLPIDNLGNDINGEPLWKTCID